MYHIFFLTLKQFQRELKEKISKMNIKNVLNFDLQLEQSKKEKYKLRNQVFSQNTGKFLPVKNRINFWQKKINENRKENVCNNILHVGKKLLLKAEDSKLNLSKNVISEFERMSFYNLRTIECSYDFKKNNRIELKNFVNIIYKNERKENILKKLTRIKKIRFMYNK